MTNYKKLAEEWLKGLPERTRIESIGVDGWFSVQQFAAHLDSLEEKKECEHPMDLSKPGLLTFCDNCGKTKDSFEQLVQPKKIEPLMISETALAHKEFSLTMWGKLNEVIQAINELRT